MKKSKHFRKDVIIARVIFAVVCILAAILIGIGVHALLGSGRQKQDSQDDPYEQSESQQNKDEDDAFVDLDKDEPADDPADQPTDEPADEPIVTVSYVQTTDVVRLRTEASTECETLTRIPAGVQLVMLEQLEGWYKVSYEGMEGYISAAYANIVQ